MCHAKLTENRQPAFVSFWVIVVSFVKWALEFGC